MKITRFNGNKKTTWEIDFSRELKLYSVADPHVSKIEHGICVPVVPSVSSYWDELHFWDSSVGVEVIIGNDSYILNKDNPKEYARLANNLVALFTLHGLG